MPAWQLRNAHEDARRGISHLPLIAPRPPTPTPPAYAGPGLEKTAFLEPAISVSRTCTRPFGPDAVPTPMPTSEDIMEVDGELHDSAGSVGLHKEATNDVNFLIKDMARVGIN